MMFAAYAAITQRNGLTDREVSYLRHLTPKWEYASKAVIGAYSPLLLGYGGISLCAL